MAFTEDLDAFLDPDEFADQAVFTLASGAITPSINGIFDDPFMNAQLGEYEAEASAPRFTCKATDVAAVRRQDLVVITTQAGVKEFGVLSMQPDGTGLVVVQLAKE